MGYAAIGRRLREARRRARMSQAEAADHLGLTASALSQYETGKRRVEALALERLAHLYGVPLSFFFGETRGEEDWEAALRGQADSLSPAGRVGLGRLVERIRQLEDLYGRMDFPLLGEPHHPFPPLPEEEFSPEEVESRAEHVRRHFDLGTAPVLDVKSFLEARGFLPFAEGLGEDPDDISGLFFTHPKLGPVVIVNSDQYYGRRSFTLAHELAHGLFHYDRRAILCRSGERSPSEQFANRFATRFLVPREALFERLREMELRSAERPEDVVRLARYFGVSYLAMYYRLRGECRIDVAAADFENVRPVVVAKELGYAPSEREFRRLRWPLEDRLPRPFIEGAYRAARIGRVSRRRAAEMLGISYIEFEERLEVEEQVRDRAEAYG